MNEILKSIPKFDEKDFREWRSKGRMCLSYHTKRFFGVFNGNSCPEDDTNAFNGNSCPEDDTNATAIEQWNSDNCDLSYILFVATTGSANIFVCQLESKRQGEGLGDGISA